MGVTISCRGSLADIERVEDFEDRVLDLALEIGGQAHVWRSVNDDDPRRVVRGLMLDLCPGQETTSLLVSPEGWLINLFEIEDASFEEQRRKQERLQRAIEKRRSRGDETGDALLSAMRDEEMSDLPGEPSLSDALREMSEVMEEEEDEEDEPWRA